MHEKQFANYLESITSEVNLINHHTQQRNRTFKNCLNQYVYSLKDQAQTLQIAQKEVEKRYGTIRLGFETVYNSIMEGSDLTMRSIRATAQKKNAFWKETIDSFVEDPNLQFKAFLHEQKAESLQRFLDAVDQRRSLTKFSYQAMLKQRNKDKTLALYQQSNDHLQTQVMRGGNTTWDKWQALHQLSADQHKMNNQEARQDSSTRAGILGRFIDNRQ